MNLHNEPSVTEQCRNRLEFYEFYTFTAPSEVVKNNESPRPLPPTALGTCPRPLASPSPRPLPPTALVTCPPPLAASIAACLAACLSARSASFLCLALKRSAIFGNEVVQARGITLWMRTPSPQKPTTSTKDIQRTSQGAPTMHQKEDQETHQQSFSSHPLSNHNMAFLQHPRGTRA